MGKIVLEIEEFGKIHSEYKIFDQDCIRIGRAFNNDLIINDPFVGASHISLKSVEGAWECENNGSLNGTFISDHQDGRTKIKIGKACPVRSGNTIFLGKTSIHIWDINHPVAPEQALDTSTPVFFDSRNTTQSLLFAFGVFSFIYYLYLSLWNWKSTNSPFQIMAGICFLLFCLVIWSAIWALITRFTKRQHRFLHHLIFSFQWAVFSFAVWFIFKYVFFFICNDSVSYIVSLVIFGLFNIFILSNHLDIGTNLSFVKRITISSLIAFSIIFLAVLGHYAAHNEFSPDPHHYINIVPVPKKLIPAISIHEEIKRLDSIF